MSEFGLEERHLKFIIDVLKKNIPQAGAAFYIFGSRAKGTYKKYSDVDIAVDLGEKPLDISVFAKIKSVFEDSTFPYEVDIVDLQSLNENFLHIIEKDLKKIN